MMLSKEESVIIDSTAVGPSHHQYKNFSIVAILQALAQNQEYKLAQRNTQVSRGDLVYAEGIPCPSKIYEPDHPKVGRSCSATATSPLTTAGTTAMSTTIETAAKEKQIEDDGADSSDDDMIDDEELKEYGELVADLGTFPVGPTREISGTKY